MATAARVQGWGRAKWRRGLGLAALPAGNSPLDGGDGGPIGLKVEIFVNSAWTDISSYVYYRGNVGVSIARGRADETSQIQPQTARMILNNRDGRFSPRNPNGPYYGQLTRNTPLRVSRLNNGIRRYRFYGEVPTWPVTSDISGRDIYTQIQASGMLRRLRQGSQPLRSPLFRYFTIGYTNAQFGQAPPLTPAAYWPCEDGQNATQIASGIQGGSSMAVSGTPTFASNTAVPGSAALPALTGSVWTGTLPVVTGATANQVQFLLSIPTAGDTDGLVVARMTTTGTVGRMDIVYNVAATGTLTVNGYSSGGSLLFTSAIGTGVDGHPLVMLMYVTPSVTPGVLTWDAEYLSLDSTLFSFAGSTVSGTLGNGSQIIINPTGLPTDSTVGHIAYQTATDPSSGTTSSTRAPANAWNGDAPIARFIRLCGEQAVPAVAEFVTGGIDPGDETAMGNQTIDTFSTLLQQCPDTLFTPMWEAREQMALMFRSKGTLYNQAAVLTLDMSQHQLSGPLVPVDDDTYTRNDITVTRVGGSDYTLVQTSGPLSVQPPPAGVGDYQTNYNLSLSNDSLLPDQAGWRLRFGTLDEPRYPQVPVNLRHPTFTSSVDLMNAALVIDIGDRLDVVNPPTPQLPPDPISQIVQGYTETLGIFEHNIVFNCTPQSPWRVGYADDVVYGHADTDGSTLAGAYPLGTETTISVATTNAASPLWTTSAGDFPFDISVGGERMTVTNITGVSSPQAFTVTRSVNGVVKGQTASTDVRLWQAMYTSV